MRIFKMALVFSALAVAVIGVGAAAAQEHNGVIADGRVNSWDLAAPVAVYCTFENPDIEDPDYSEFSGIELWGINEDSEGRLILTVDAETISEVGVDADEALEIASAEGFTLYRNADGSFAVIAPADFEGKTYSFSWEFGDQSC